MFFNTADYFQDKILQKQYEFLLEHMLDRGYTVANLRKNKDGITITVDDEETTGMKIDHLEAENWEDAMEQVIDITIDKPKYEYDQETPITTYSTPGGRRTGPEHAWGDDMYGAVYPGTMADIPSIEQWVRNVKINEDRKLQDAKTESKKAFDQTVRRTVYKVARKIYYVGRKPKNVEPEEWDALTRDMRPGQGTYSKGDLWVNMEFPYTADYKYRSGMFVEGGE